MGSFIVFDPLNQKEATKTWKGLKQWFADNPRRKVCTTDLGKIRRTFMKEDFLKYCAPNVTLPD